MNPNPPPTPPPSQSGNTSMMSIPIIIGAIVGIIIAVGAAKLSYDKYGSLGWAILAFIFSPVYYPYYAFFVSTRASMLGGRRK